MSENVENYVNEWSRDHQWTVIGAAITVQGVLGPHDNKRKWFKNEEDAIEEAVEVAARVAGHGGELTLLVVKANYRVFNGVADPAVTETL